MKMLIETIVTFNPEISLVLFGYSAFRIFINLCFMNSFFSRFCWPTKLLSSPFNQQVSSMCQLHYPPPLDTHHGAPAGSYRRPLCVARPATSSMTAHTMVTRGTHLLPGPCARSHTFVRSSFFFCHCRPPPVPFCCRGCVVNGQTLRHAKHNGRSTLPPPCFVCSPCLCTYNSPAGRAEGPGVEPSPVLEGLPPAVPPPSGSLAW